MKNKAQISTLKALIISLAFVIILLAFISLKLYPSMKEASRLAACKSSVETNARSHLSALDFSKNIECPTKEITIKTKEQQEIKKKIADEMVECWDIFKKGEANLFENKDAMFCSICSRIDFKNKYLEVKGFSKFLAETKKPNSDKTYLEYLARYETGNAAKVLKEQKTNYNFEQESFPTDKTYMVTFVYAKGKDSIKKLSNFLSAKTTAAKIGYTAAGISAAAGGIGVGLAAIGILSNPVGWAIGIGAGIVSIGSLITSYFLDPTNVPEWIALVVFTEYTGENLEEIGCEYLPVAQYE